MSLRCSFAAYFLHSQIMFSNVSSVLHWLVEIPFFLLRRRSHVKKGNLLEVTTFSICYQVIVAQVTSMQFCCVFLTFAENIFKREFSVALVSRDSLSPAKKTKPCEKREPP
ncbi:hypothetical protein WA026_011382 [Henosepilachna vigintioctopunctata]|uniref:Secreted protein n=1 Tax=Henosepilachna vigintioctopunctata TaxID=420089 RepID=A0AAW1TRM1_9CUCU